MSVVLACLLGVAQGAEGWDAFRFGLSVHPGLHGELRFSPDTVVSASDDAEDAAEAALAEAWSDLQPSLTELVGGGSTAVGFVVGFERQWSVFRAGVNTSFLGSISAERTFEAEAGMATVSWPALAGPSGFVGVGPSGARATMFAGYTVEATLIVTSADTPEGSFTLYGGALGHGPTAGFEWHTPALSYDLRGTWLVGPALAGVRVDLTLVAVSRTPRRRAR